MRARQRGIVAENIGPLALAICVDVIFEMAAEANARSRASLAAVRVHEGGIGSSAAATSAGGSADGVR